MALSPTDGPAGGHAAAAVMGSHPAICYDLRSRNQ